MKSLHIEVRRSSGEVKRRARHAKTKTGCSTCKIRRVKCDERRPTCRRCENFGRKCDGYPISAVAPIQRELMPRLTSHLKYTPAVLLPGSEEERHYYQLFCSETAADLRGYFPTDFWDRTVLQESHSETYIKHAVVALGALSKTYLENQSSPVSTGGPETERQTKHHEFALRQYNKAILKLRHAISNGKVDLRKALVACLLFVCFENFHGDYDAGIQHMKCGLGLLDQWRSQHFAASPNGRLTDSHLASLIHDEVFQMFARLDAQAFAHLGSESSLYPDPKLLLWKTVGRKGFKIPTFFVDVAEARKCWDALMQRTVYFHKLLISSAHDTTEKAAEDVAKEHELCRTLLGQFEKAIYPLTEVLLGDDSSSASDGATILYSSSKISVIFLETCTRPGEVQYDLYNDQFSEIISKLRPVVERARNGSSTRQSHFKFDLGTVLPLHLTALKCRRPEIRRQAIALLLAIPAREGDWDGIMLAKVDAWLMNLEEESMNEHDFVPEHARWRLAKIDWNLQQRWIKAEFNQGSYQGNGVWCHFANSKKAHITW